MSLGSKDLQTVHIQNSPIQNSPKQNSPKNHIMEEKTVQYKTVRFKVHIKSYPLLASSQHVGATAAVTFCLLCFLNKGQFLACRLVKTIINWDCFSDCFVSDFFLLIFILFRNVLYWIVLYRHAAYTKLCAYSVPQFGLVLADFQITANFRHGLVKFIAIKIQFVFLSID